MIRIYLIQLVIFVLPVVSLLIGGIGFFVFKNTYITPVIVAVVASISVFTLFNSSFWIWVISYTFLSFLSGVVVKLFYSKKQAAYT